MQSLLHALSIAERVERAAAVIYRALAKRFPGDATAGVFERLAAEEDQHAMRVRMLRSQYAADTALLDDAEVDARELERTLAESEALRELAEGDAPLSLAEAKRLAAALEQRFAAAHAHAIAHANPRLRSFFEALARADQEHAQMLSEAGE